MLFEDKIWVKVYSNNSETGSSFSWAETLFIALGLITSNKFRIQEDGNYECFASVDCYFPGEFWSPNSSQACPGK